MGKKRKELSQAEIWDDSALLRSWDDALAEYKFYHSIHARGERVEDVIKEAEREGPDMTLIEDDLRPAVAGMQVTGSLTEELEDGEVEQEPGRAHPQPSGDSIEDSHGTSTVELEQQERPANASTAIDQKERQGMPFAIVNGVKDGALKDLMISWYYAGYYTGLYEGQQQAEKTPPVEGDG